MESKHLAQPFKHLLCDHGTVGELVFTTDVAQGVKTIKRTGRVHVQLLDHLQKGAIRKTWPLETLFA